MTPRADLGQLLNFDGSNPYLLSQPGDYGVDAGPVPTARFRKDIAQMLAETLSGVQVAEADKALAEGRVRVVQGISRRAAEALVERMGRREAAAEVVQGEPPRKSPWSGGTPVIGGVAGGVAGALMLEPFIGAAIGGAILAGLAFANSRRRQSVLGSPPLRPEVPHQVAEAPDRLAAIIDQLPAAARERVLTVGRVGFHIIGRLLDENDLISVAGDGLGGGLGQAAIDMVSEAVRIGELIAAGGTGADNTRRMEQLDGLARAANRALDELDRLEQALEADPGSAEEAMQRETQLLSATVDELRKMR